MPYEKRTIEVEVPVCDQCGAVSWTPRIHIVEGKAKVFCVKCEAKSAPKAVQGEKVETAPAKSRNRVRKTVEGEERKSWKEMTPAERKERQATLAKKRTVVEKIGDEEEKVAEE